MTNVHRASTEIHDAKLVKMTKNSFRTDFGRKTRTQLSTVTNRVQKIPLLTFAGARAGEHRKTFKAAMKLQ